MKISFHDAVDFLAHASDYWVNGMSTFVKVIEAGDQSSITYYDDTVMVMAREVVIMAPDVIEVDVNKRGFVLISLRDGTHLGINALDERQWNK